MFAHSFAILFNCIWRAKPHETSSDSKVLARDWIEKTLKDVKTRPIVQDEKTIGFKLSRVREESIYSKLGLQSGDVLQSINGVELQDATQAIQTLNSMQNESVIVLKFKRAGKFESRRIAVEK